MQSPNGLNGLALIAIEHEISNKLNLNVVVLDLVKTKFRKKLLW